MLKIKGKVREMKRVNVKAPDDKVHRYSRKDGRLKGCRSVMLNDKTLLPRGMSGFYIRHKKDTGIKIFYSMHNDRCCKLKTVKKQFKKHLKLYELGVAAKPHKIVTVKLNFDYYEKDMKFARHVKKESYGIKVQHVNYPKGAWAKYAQGYPYDWDAVDHPNHTPKGYLKFCRKLKKVLKANKIGVCGSFPFIEKENPKLGDIVWCCKKNRWYIVDCGD